MKKGSEKSLPELIQTVHRLRAPGGCPWDRAQTHQTLRQYLIEEAYEVLDVLDRIHTTEDLKNPKIRDAFCEELGDLLMQVLLHSEMTSEQGAFNIEDVAQTLNDKLIRRHPHVFGDQKAENAEQAYGNWEKQKAKEKQSDAKASILDGLPQGLPALQRAARVLEKVTKVGFQWDDISGPINKVQEEWGELKEELQKPNKNIQKIEDELGDVLFTLCNVGFVTQANPETALRTTLTRFEKRFKYVEMKLKELGKTPEQSNLEEMDKYWDEAKTKEKKGEL